MTRNVDILVLGSGVCGLLVARELRRAGQLSIAIADAEPLAGAASTRNQGWLQSGTLWAGTYKNAPYINLLHEGFNYIRLHYRDALLGSGGIYLLEKDDALKRRFLGRATLFNLELRYREMDTLQREYPLVQGNIRHIGAVEVADCYIDSHRLLSRVVEELRFLGVSFTDLTADRITQISRWNGRWEVETDASPIRASELVIAYGAHCWEFVKRFGGTLKQRDIWQVPMLSIFHPIAPTVITGGTRPFFSIVPMRDRRGEPGVTAFILENVDFDRQDAIPFDHREWAKRLGRAAKHCVPALFDSDARYEGSIHICRKPALGGEGYIVEDVPIENGIAHVVTTEYLTIAPVAARHCAAVVLGALSGKSAAGMTQSAAMSGVPLHVPSVSLQPYRSVAAPVAESWTCEVEIDSTRKELDIRCLANTLASAAP